MKRNHIKNVMNQELEEMKTDKLHGKQMIRQWQASNSTSDVNCIPIEKHGKVHRKVAYTLMRYGSYVACFLLVLTFTTMFVVYAKTDWGIWTSQMFSGKDVNEDGQENKALEGNKSITIGNYQLQVQEYTMDQNGFLYLLVTIKDDAGNNVSDDLPLSLYWSDGKIRHSIEQQSVVQARDIKDRESNTPPYGYSISAICPSLINPTNTLVFELDGASGEDTGICVTEPDSYQYTDNHTLVSFSPYGFLMKNSSRLSQMMDHAINQNVIATYTDGTKDTLQVSNYGGMKGNDVYDAYLQFSPAFQYQNNINQQIVWDEENYSNLIHSFTSYKFNVSQLQELTLEDGTVLFKR